MLGAMTAFGTRRASLEPSVRGVVARAALDAAWNCGARASALGGVAGLLAWYISFDRSCSLGQDRIFDLQWSSLLALIPVGIWSAVTTAHTASAMICRRLEGRSVCGNCGYPLNAGTLAPCPECGPARTHGASGRPVWRQQCFALGVSTTIGMLLAMGIGGCESQFMKATWTRWLVLRSNLVSKGIRAWIVPNKTFHMTWARENLRLRIVAPGPGFKTLGVQVCDADGNQVLPEEIRTEEHRGVVHARFVVHGSKFTVRGPWWYAGPVYMVDFEKAPESFEEARGPVELCP